MSQKTQTPASELRLVKIKSWYIPGDTSSYQALRQLKIPLLKVHKDFIPTLFLATKRAGLKPISVPFNDILHGYLDKVGGVWKSKKGRNCRLSDNRLMFTAPLTAMNKESIRKLDVSLAAFFERWAHKYTPTYSTDNDRLRLVVDYWFAPERDPVIRTVEQVPNQSFELDLGFTKIKFTFLDTRIQKTENRSRQLPPLIQTEVLIKTGTVWALAHTSTCLSSEVGDLSQFMAALAILHGRREVEAK